MRFGITNKKRTAILQKSRPKKLTLPLRFALIILIYGALFKIMHWPYAQTLMLFGSLFILILYTIRFVLKTEKAQLDYVKLALVVVWVIGYVLQVLHILNVPYIFNAILLALFGWWFIEEGLNYFTKRKLKDNGILKFFYYGFSICSLTLIIIGALFKIQHWPYGALMFTCGILLLSLMLIVDYFAIKRPTD